MDDSFRMVGDGADDLDVVSTFTNATTNGSILKRAAVTSGEKCWLKIRTRIPCPFAVDCRNLEVAEGRSKTNGEGHRTSFPDV